MRTAAAAIVIALSAVAYADDELAEARRLEAALEYDRALVLVEAALGKGGASPERYVELSLLAGRLAAGLDRPDVAEQHFVHVLALRPDTRLPDGTSPKIVEPFERARARTRPLAVRLAISRGLVTLVVDDAHGLVAGMALHVVDSTGAHEDLVHRTTRAALPPDREVVEVAALDRHGNRLRIASPPTTPTASARPVYARWPTWAIVAGASLAGATFAGWRFSVAQDTWDRMRAEGTHDFSALRTVEERGERWGLVANLGLGLGAAAAITATVLYVRNRDRDAVTLTTGPGLGAGLAARF